MNSSIRTKLALTFFILILLLVVLVAWFFDASLMDHFDKAFRPNGFQPAWENFDKMTRPFMQSVRSSLIWGALSASVIAFALSYFLAGIFTSKIDQLRKATEEISKGNYDHRLVFDTDDEFTILADSLNDMAAAIEEVQNLRQDLVANVSHEISTPLTNIRGYLEAIDDGLIDGKKREKTIKMLLDEANYLTRVVEDIKNFSQFDKSDLSFNFKKQDFASFAKKVTESQKGVFEKKGLELHFEGDKEMVDFDEFRMKQVLVNLLTNSLKYSEKGIVKVEVFKGGFSVSDQGKGIEKSDLKRIFERFYKTDKARKRDGVGLGLSIVSEIVKRHGFKIEVNSNVGKGTEVKVLF